MICYHLFLIILFTNVYQKYGYIHLFCSFLLNFVSVHFSVKKNPNSSSNLMLGKYNTESHVFDPKWPILEGARNFDNVNLH